MLLGCPKPMRAYGKTTKVTLKAKKKKRYKHKR